MRMYLNIQYLQQIAGCPVLRESPLLCALHYLPHPKSNFYCIIPAFETYGMRNSIIGRHISNAMLYYYFPNCASL